MNKDKYKAKCKWLAEFYAEAAETGKLLQQSGMTAMSGPNLNSDPQDWRLKPEPQKFWVVWEPTGYPCVFLGEEPAKNHAKLSGGTIQELTKPE